MELQELQNDPTVLWEFEVCEADPSAFTLKVKGQPYDKIMELWALAKSLASEELCDLMVGCEKSFGVMGHSKGGLRVHTGCKAHTTAWQNREITDKIGDPTVYHRCPDRQDGHNQPDTWRQFSNGQRVCSCCGSLHPDDMLALLQEHGTACIDPSDKNYKWYLAAPFSAINAMLGPIKYYRTHDTPELVNYLTALAEKIED